MCVHQERAAAGVYTPEGAAAGVCTLEGAASVDGSLPDSFELTYLPKRLKMFWLLVLLYVGSNSEGRYFFNLSQTSGLR